MDKSKLHKKLNLRFVSAHYSNLILAPEFNFIMKLICRYFFVRSTRLLNFLFFFVEFFKYTGVYVQMNYD